MLIGLTGKICSGKNFVCSLLEKNGAISIDLDKTGHTVLREEKNALVKLWGEGILDAQGNVNRAAIAKRVFKDAAELRVLESIVHPAVDKKIQKWYEANQTKTCIINAALLHKSSFFSKLDAIIIVEATLPVRFFRAYKRDRSSVKEIFARFYAQRNFSRFYKELKKINPAAHVIKIKNNRGAPNLKKTANLFYQFNPRNPCS